MRLRSISFSLAFVALASLAWASGCTIELKNIEFCRDKGKYGAVCAYWINAKETQRNIPPLEWNSKRIGMVCASEKGFGNIKATVEKLCQNKKCVENSKALIEAIKNEETIK